MKFRVLLAALLAAAVALAVLRKRGSGDEILIGEYGSLTGTTATFGQSTDNGIKLAFDEINAAGGVLGKKLRVIVEDDQSQARRGGDRRHEADQPEPRGRDPRRGRLVALARGGADLPGQPGADDLALLDEPPGHPGRRLHLPRLLHRSLPGRGDGEVRGEHAEAEEGRDPRRRPQRLLGRPADLLPADTSRSSAARSSPSSPTARATRTSARSSRRSSPPTPRRSTCPATTPRSATIARQARELGITVPLLGGDGWDSPRLFEIGGEALNGCYFSNHYSVDDPAPAIQKFVARLRKQVQRDPGRARRPRLRRGQDPRRRDDARGLDGRRQGARRHSPPRRTSGRHRQDHHRRRAQRGQAGGRPEDRERQVRVRGDHQADRYVGGQAGPNRSVGRPRGADSASAEG